MKNEWDRWEDDAGHAGRNDAARARLAVAHVQNENYRQTKAPWQVKRVCLQAKSYLGHPCSQPLSILAINDTMVFTVAA
jgi:hypothetical protein